MSLRVRPGPVAAALTALAGAALVLASCTSTIPGGAAAPATASGGSAANPSASATVGPAAEPTWPAPAASPEIAAAQSTLGAVGRTVLTWSDAADAVGVSLDYVLPYTPSSGYALAKGTKAIELDLRVINASTLPLDLEAWSIYASIDNKPLAAVKDSRYVPITSLPVVNPQGSGYIRARVVVPDTGGTMLVGVADDAYPNQPATFTVTVP